MEYSVGSERKIVWLIWLSSVISGIVIRAAVHCLGNLNDAGLCFIAYLVGSIGFMLTAPVAQYNRMRRSLGDGTGRFVLGWLLFTIVIAIIACLVGFLAAWLFSLGEAESTSQAIAGNFLWGVSILFASGVIYQYFHKN